MTDRKGLLRDYDRQMLRSSFLSLFWGVINDKRRVGKFTLQRIADTLGIDKSGVSRTFSSPPNWTVDKIADIAGALDVEISIEARSRVDGTIYMPSSVIRTAATSSGYTKPSPQTPIAIATGIVARNGRTISANAA